MTDDKDNNNSSKMVAIELVQLKESLKSMIDLTSKQLDAHQKLLEKHGEHLESINKTLTKLAVQDEKIKNIENVISKLGNNAKDYSDSTKSDISTLDDKVDNLEKIQSGCPINQIKYLWMIVLPMGLTQIATAITLISQLFGG